MQINDKKNDDLLKKEAFRKTKSSKRTFIKDKLIIPETAQFGTVVEVGTKLYVVEYAKSNGEIATIDCFAAGIMLSPHKYSTLICCGDNVRFINDENNIDAANYGTILQVVERKSKISRTDPANNNREHVIVANADTLLIFASVFDPQINFRLIDRLLVAAILGKITAAICINKIELANMDLLEEFFEPYNKLNLLIFPISIKENSGLFELKEFLRQKNTVMVGSSGVGKSTLLNHLVGRKVQKVLEIRDSSGKGRHTTSYVKQFELPFGGKITDTPGIREFGLWDLAKDELPLFFCDFNDFFQGCKYLSCTHTHEPHCKVKEAIEKGLISTQRYDSYINLLDTLK